MSGSRKEQRDRECGLTFSWRSPEVSKWNTCVAVLLVSLLTVAFVGVVRVKITPPPRIIERHASIMMIPEGADARSWAISMDEQGPFPSRFDVSKDPNLLKLERQWLDDQTTREIHPPKLRDLPSDVNPGAVAVSLRGQRVFPQESSAATAPTPVAPRPPRPLLSLLSNLPASSWPSEFPAYPQSVPPAVEASSWKFMLELGPGGRVVGWQPMEPVDDEPSSLAIRGIGEWLGQLKFGTSTKPGWIGVEVSFTRQP